MATAYLKTSSAVTATVPIPTQREPLTCDPRNRFAFYLRLSQADFDASGEGRGRQGARRDRRVDPRSNAVAGSVALASPPAPFAT